MDMFQMDVGQKLFDLLGDNPMGWVNGERPSLEASRRFGALVESEGGVDNPSDTMNVIVSKMATAERSVSYLAEPLDFYEFMEQCGLSNDDDKWRNVVFLVLHYRGWSCSRGGRRWRPDQLSEAGVSTLGNVINNTTVVNGVTCTFDALDEGTDPDELGMICGRLRELCPDRIIVLGTPDRSLPNIMVAVPDNMVDAGIHADVLAKAAAGIVVANPPNNPGTASISGNDRGAIPDALLLIEESIRQQLPA